MSVQIEIPEAFEELQAPYVLELPVSVAEKVGMTFGTGTFETVFSVIVITEVEIPFATIFEVPLIVVKAALTSMAPGGVSVDWPCVSPN